MALIDITPPLSARTPVFPGDTAFCAEPSWTMSETVPVNVSRLVMSSHAGAHADAPLHYDAAGASIDAVDVAAYIGPCIVVHVVNDEAAVTADALAVVLGALTQAVPPRVLVRTYQIQPQDWDPAFTAVDAAAIDWLAGAGVRLIGVDTPSLDPAASKTMDAHKAVRRNDMRVLEGLLLDHVAPGLYELIAPPLKLAGLDAAPVRALLRTPT